LAQEEIARRQNRIADIVAPVFITDQYFAPEIFARVLQLRSVEHQSLRWAIVEQTRRLVKEEGQIILDSRWSNALADILINRTVARSIRKVFVPAVAKPANGFFIQGEFMGGKQLDAFHLVDRALAVGIERTDGFNFIVE